MTTERQQADRAPLQALVDRRAVDPVAAVGAGGRTGAGPPQHARALMRRLSQPNASAQGFRVSRLCVATEARRLGCRTAERREGRMRILLVGAGGVGGAITTIAARRAFFDAVVVADYDPARAEKAVAAVGRPTASPPPGSTPPTRPPSAALLAEHRCDVLLNATDPRFVMPLFRAALAAGADYLDMAMSLSHPRPGRPVRADRREARRRAVRPGRRSGRPRPAGARRHGRRARPVRRVRPLRRRPPLLPRSTRSASATASNLTVARLRLRAVVLHLDDDRGVPQPAGDLGDATAAGSPPSRSASPRCSTSPRASGRSSASTSSTRRCSSCRAGSTPGGSPSSTGSARSSSTS